MDHAIRVATVVSSGTMVTLHFSGGTIELRGFAEGATGVPASCQWDARTACHRAPAIAYAEIVRALTHEKIEFTDEARRYPTLEGGARVHREPRPYQSEALAAWQANRGRGLVAEHVNIGRTGQVAGEQFYADQVQLKLNNAELLRFHPVVESLRLRAGRLVLPGA